MKLTVFLLSSWLCWTCRVYSFSCNWPFSNRVIPITVRSHGHYGPSNHGQCECLFKKIGRDNNQKTPKYSIIGPERASSAECVSLWRRLSHKYYVWLEYNILIRHLNRTMFIYHNDELCVHVCITVSLCSDSRWRCFADRCCRKSNEQYLPDIGNISYFGEQYPYALHPCPIAYKYIFLLIRVCDQCPARIFIASMNQTGHCRRKSLIRFIRTMCAYHSII